MGVNVYSYSRAFRAIASNMQTKTLASVICCFVFVVYSHHKHPKHPERELNHGHCLSHNSFLGHCISHNLFLATSLSFIVYIVYFP